MGRFPSRAALAVAPLFGVAVPSGASELCTDDAMIVFDGSGSMAEMGFNLLGEPRIFDARRAVREAVPGIARTRRLGLIVYGPGQGDVCGNVALRFRPRWDAAGAIVAAVDALRPAGATPLTAAVREAAEVLDFRRAPGAIVLVTDGVETCGGAPCALADMLVREAADLTVHVIGFKVRSDHFDWAPTEGVAPTVAAARCLADRTGGRYETAETAGDPAAPG